MSVFADTKYNVLHAKQDVLGEVRLAAVQDELRKEIGEKSIRYATGMFRLKVNEAAAEKYDMAITGPAKFKSFAIKGALNGESIDVDFANGPEVTFGKEIIAVWLDNTVSYHEAVSEAKSLHTFKPIKIDRGSGKNVAGLYYFVEGQDKNAIECTIHVLYKE